MSVYDLGQSETIQLEFVDPVTGLLVTPASIVVDLTDPSGAVTHPSTTTDGVGLAHFLVAFSTAGVWRWRVTTTTPNDVRDGVLVAAALYADVPWLPSVTDVANYVTARTLPMDTPGVDIPLGTFTNSTIPTGAQVDSLILTAASYVAARCGIMNAGLYAFASSVAAIRAAALVELAYPVRDQNLNTADALMVQADAMLAALADANAVTGVGATLTSTTVPMWVYPDPVPWGDKIIV